MFDIVDELYILSMMIELIMLIFSYFDIVEI